jgi:hypothetical protein
MPILTNSMKKYVLNESRGFTIAQKSIYNKRIVNYACKGIKDLALLAEKLPEKQQAEIFNRETLKPLIEKVFTMPKGEFKDKQEYEEKRKRILQLCFLVLETIGAIENAWKLAPDIMDMLTKAGLYETIETLKGLKAVYLAGFKVS